MTEPLRRDIAPEIRDFERFRFPMPETLTSDNGIRVYVIPGEKQEVTRTDVIFMHGSYDQRLKLQASATASAMCEATTGRTSAKVSEFLDFYGGWLQKSVSYHYTIFTLYAPNSSFGKLLPLFMELITSPRFGKKDLSLYKVKGKEEFKVKEERVDFMADRKFREVLFGSHPYGLTASATDFGGLDTDSLKEYHRDYYAADSCSVVFSGCIGDAMTALLLNGLCSIKTGGDAASKAKEVPDDSGKERFSHVKKGGALQCAVRMGGTVINRDNPDYMQLTVLNTVLGGYFGSRLMKNIREEKGYTYGINSWVMGLRDAAYISISSQSAVDFTGPLIKEVFNEIDNLRNEKISGSELKTVKGYMQGELARTFDNRFTMADALVTMIINMVPMDYFDRKADAVNNASPETLLEIARKYLRPEEMFTVVAGGDGNEGMFKII